MPSTTTFRRGLVVVVEVTFTGQRGSKLRPAVVVSAPTFHDRLPDLIVCPISSQSRFFANPGAGDVPLANWRYTRLRHPSTVRVSNIVAVEKKIIRRELGTLRHGDLAAVDEMLHRAFGLRHAG